MLIKHFSKLFLLFLLLAQNTQAASGKTLSLTIDDLPWTSLPERAPPDVLARHHALVRQLNEGKVPAIGFVNEGKLYRADLLVPERVQMLRDWLDAGLQLGNHTRDHLDLHEVGLPAFQANILTGEQVLSDLLRDVPHHEKWFRHPYLHAGKSPAVRAELAAFLHDHSYQVAPVTFDNSEWIFAKAFHDCVLRADCTASTQAELIDAYIPYMRDKIRYYEAQSQKFFGRQIAQILLLHANELNAACLPRLLTMIGEEGYALVPLRQAIQDPIYQHDIGYNGAAGPSWIHRWAMAMGYSGKDFAGEPTVPMWVLQQAGLEHE